LLTITKRIEFLASDLVGRRVLLRQHWTGLLSRPCINTIPFNRLSNRVQFYANLFKPNPMTISIDSFSLSYIRNHKTSAKELDVLDGYFCLIFVSSTIFYLYTRYLERRHLVHRTNDPSPRLVISEHLYD
jgi:hypothetical protein